METNAQREPKTTKGVRKTHVGADWAGGGSSVLVPIRMSSFATTPKATQSSPLPTKRKPPIGTESPLTKRKVI